MFPGDEAGYAIDDQYYVGDSGLLFKPVVKEGATETDVYLSDDQVRAARWGRKLMTAILRLLYASGLPSLFVT